MFPTRFFNVRAFARRFWPKVGANVAANVSTVSLIGIYAPTVSITGRYRPTVSRAGIYAPTVTLTGKLES